MAKNPSFPFYASDFLTDTNSWDALEVGIYIRLLSTQWVNGCLPEDLSRLARISGVPDDVFKKAWVYFSFKFALVSGQGYKNQKLEEVRNEKIAFIEKQKENGKRGGRGNKSDKNKGLGLESLSPKESQIKPLEEEKEIEDEEEFEKRNEKLLVPSMLKIFVENNSSYPISIEEDYAALGRIVKFIKQQEGIKEDPATDIKAGELVKTMWVHLSSCLSKIPFYSTKSLKTISNNLQSITIEIQKNGTKGFDYQKANDLLNSFGD